MSPETQLILSALTLILTPIFSAIVIAYQLSRGQGYWKEQQEFLRQAETFKLRVDLLKKASVLVSRVNEQIVQHHIYVSSRDVAIAFAKLIKDSDPKGSTFFQNEYDSFRIKAAQSYLEARETSFQLTELSAELAVYLGVAMAAHVIAIRDKANLATNPIFTPEEIADRVKMLLHEQKSFDSANAIMAREYDAISEPRRPLEESKQFLGALTTAVIGKAA